MKRCRVGSGCEAPTRRGAAGQTPLVRTAPARFPGASFGMQMRELSFLGCDLLAACLKCLLDGIQACVAVNRFVDELLNEFARCALVVHKRGCLEDRVAI